MTLKFTVILITVTSFNQVKLFSFKITKWQSPYFRTGIQKRLNDSSTGCLLKKIILPCPLHTIEITFRDKGFHQRDTKIYRYKLYVLMYRTWFAVIF